MLRCLPAAAVDLLARQHGVATSAQLQSVGLTMRALGVSVQRRLLLNPYRGIYVDRREWGAASDETRHAMRLLAVQLVAPDAVGIDSTAAVALQLPVRRVPDAPQVARLPHRGKIRGAEVTRTTIDDGDTVTTDGLTVTSLALTAVSIAVSSSLPDALITMDAVLRRRTPWVEIQAQIGQLAFATQERAAQRALDHADPWSESWLESLSRGRAIEVGMPPPLCNVTIIFNGREARVDHLWVELGVIGEADGKDKYEKKGRAADAHWLEKQRHEWLEEIGFDLARWGTREVAAGGAALKRRFDRAVARHKRSGIGWPEGVRAELRRLVGVAPPPRVVGEVERLRSLGYPICFVESDAWRSAVRPRSLWTPPRPVAANE